MPTVYTGRPFSQSTGLQNNLNRWYDSITGRWLSKDPIASDLNLYRYCGNDPTTYDDPQGLATVGISPVFKQQSFWTIYLA